MECFNLKWSERELLKTREHYGMEDFIPVVSLDDDGLWMGVFPGSKRTRDNGSIFNGLFRTTRVLDKHLEILHK